MPANATSRGHAISPLLTAADSNAVLVGFGHSAAYALFWGRTHGKLQGVIWQWLIGPSQLPGQKVPWTHDSTASFTGTVVGSRVKVQVVGDGLIGATVINGRIRSGRLLSLSDPVAGHGVMAFRTEKNLNRFTTVWNRMYYGEWDRLHHSTR